MSGGICRLCCKSDNVLWEVFVNVKEEISLAAKIFVCFGVKIQEDDAITKRICKSCYFFTNSAYEYRISAQQNDTKLKKAYEETVRKEELIPRHISQDDFLSTFNLANKNNVNEKPKVRQYHPSVQRLKRKYPDINIPPSFHRINIDPIVLLDRSDINQWNDESTHLGIWAVNRKKFKSQTGVTLTRVRRKSVDYAESSDTSERSIPAKKKRKKILWCEPRRKSLRFTLRRKAKSDTNVTTNNENKTIKIPTEETDEKSVPRITRSAAKFADSVKKSFEEEIKFSIEPNISDVNVAENIESDDCDNLPNLRKIINESFQNLESNEKQSNLDKPINAAVQNDRLSDNESTTKLKSQIPNQTKISSVQSSSMQKVPDQILSTKSLLARAGDTDSIFTDNDGDNLFMVVGQEVTTYICQTCNKIFDSLALLNSHKKHSHRSSLRCSKCSKKFAVVESLMRHEIAVHQPEKNNYKMSQPEIMKLENNGAEMNQPENNASEISQPENATSVIRKIENPITTVSNCPSPIFEMLPETSASVVGPIEIPIPKVCEPNNPTSNLRDSENLNSTIQSSSSANLIADNNNTQSKLFVTLGNPEGSQGSSQNCDASKKSDQKLMPRYIPPILKHVARKSTARHNLKRKANETQVEKDLKIEAECVISSDDDVEILGVIRKIPVIQNRSEPTTELSMDVLDTALQAQLKQVPQVNLNETTATGNTTSGILEKALQPQILTETDNESGKNTAVDVKQKNVKLRDDQVLLIVESDPEDDSVMFVPNDKQVHPKDKSPEAGPSTSKKEDSANNSCKNFTNEIRQHIMMISNPQEKRAASNSSAPNTNNSNNKITNEGSYINYIFNKCRYSDKFAISEQKWILKDLQKVLHRNYVPVELEYSNVNEVTASYVVPPLPTKLLTYQTNAYWNYEYAIKLPAKKPEFPAEQPKTNVAEKRVNSSNLPPVSLNSRVTMPAYSKAAISANSIVPISINNMVPLSTNNLPVSTNMVPISINNVPISTNNIPISTNKVPISTNNVPTSTNIMVPTSTNNKVPISTNKAPIPTNNLPTLTNNMVPVLTNYVPISTNNKVPISTNNIPISTNHTVPIPANSKVPISPTSKVPISTYNKVPIPANSKVPISPNNKVPISTNNKVPISTSNIVPISTSNIVPISTSNIVPISTNSKVPTSSVSNVSMPKFPIPRNSRLTIPSTMVTVPYVNGQGVVTNSMLNSFLATPTTNVTQNPLPNVPTSKGEQINLIYILESSPAAGSKDQLTLNTNTGAPQFNDNSANKINDLNQQQKQILLNGVPYHNYAKFRYDNLEPSQPMLLRQIMGQPTNVSIQNYVSVNQTNIASTSRDFQQQYINSMMPVNQTNPSVNCSNSPASTPPGASNQSDLRPKYPLTRPAIRIKDLSELTGKPSVNIEDRNILHGFYSNTVHTYINHSMNNSANNSQANNTDEFVQIT